MYGWCTSAGVDGVLVAFGWEVDGPTHPGVRIMPNRKARAKELEYLREAYDSLKDVVRGIESAQTCIDAMNFGVAKDHLKAARWHTEQAKKSLAVVGQAKNQKASN